MNWKAFKKTVLIMIGIVIGLGLLMLICSSETGFHIVMAILGIFTVLGLGFYIYSGIDYDMKMKK